MIYVLPLLLVFSLFPSLSVAQVWPNKPASFGTVLDCPFNVKPTPSRDPAGCGIENFYNAGSIVTDSTAPVSPPNTYRSRLEAGASVGGTQLNYVTPSTYREMYVGVKWRTNPAFIGKTGAGNKLMFLRGPVSNGVLMMYGRGTIGFSHNSGNVNNDHTCVLDLGLQCNPNVGSGAVSMGVWTTLELYIKSSTTNTSRDGILRWWVNGNPVGNYTNMNISSLGLNEWVWSETWDGCGLPNGDPRCDLSANTSPSEHYLDQLTIAVAGGGVNLDNPPGAPGLVSGFTATVGGVQ